MSFKPIKMDNWLSEIIVDPLSKEPLVSNEERTLLISPYGRQYPIVGELFDLRLLNNETTPDQKVWKEGQREYEKWSASLAVNDHAQDYFAEIEGVREVYEDIPIEGRCLDVGGHQGRLRQFLRQGQEYVTCDPFINVFEDLEKQTNLLMAFPSLAEPVNFVCCDAEFLPFKSASFETVHMRSVIDHLLSPELALNEAYRVLQPGSALIVGLFCQGGKEGRIGFSRLTKEFAKEALAAAGIDKFKDHHVWHPTYQELTELISSCGFDVHKVHWQKGCNNSVCYLRAIKRSVLRRRETASR